MKKFVPINPTEEVELKMGTAVGKRPGANARWIERTQELLGERGGRGGRGRSGREVWER